MSLPCARGVLFVTSGRSGASEAYSARLAALLAARWAPVRLGRIAPWCNHPLGEAPADVTGKKPSRPVLARAAAVRPKSAERPSVQLQCHT